MGDESRAYMLRPGEGRPVGEGPAQAWFKAGNAETGGAFNFHYNERDRGGGPGTPLHIHHRDDECVLVLEGETDVICGAQRFHATAERAAAAGLIAPAEVDAWLAQARIAAAAGTLFSATPGFTVAGTKP